VYLQPIDFPQIMQIYFRRVMPRAFIIIESDMWLGMLHAARKADVPVIVASGRISDRAVLRAKYSNFYYRFVFAHLTKVLARNAHDAQNFSKLGCDETKIDIAPDLKILSSFVAVRKGQAPNLTLHGRKVLVWGSLREKEESIAFDAIEFVLARLPNVLHVVAPRKPESFDIVCSQLDARKINFARRSRVLSVDKLVSVLVVDTIGELAAFYTTADLA
jgi:3-deoxy-D-manno-octulosonic-acid transferase